MADKLDRAASTAGTFTIASSSAVLFSAVPVALVALSIGIMIWLADNMLMKGSGR